MNTTMNIRSVHVLSLSLVYMYSDAFISPSLSFSLSLSLSLNQLSFLPLYFLCLSKLLSLS